MYATLLTPIDFYCERTGPEFWSEPVNALTNLAFVFAGIWGLREARRFDADGNVVVLSWWAIAIGIGSALFHTFANELTKWADIVPIAIFTLVYTFFALRRFLKLPRNSALLVLTGFYAGAGIATALVPNWLRVASNGTTGYLPPFLAFIAMGLATSWRGGREGKYLIAAGLVFAVSLICRMIDLDVCAEVPVGTHFLWHTFNGLMLAILLSAAARYGAREPMHR